jgi:hypothetical protein
MVYGGGVRKPLKVIFFNAILFNSDYISDPDELLEPLFGKPILKTKYFNFDHTEYYVPEMGTSLVKYFAGYDIMDYPDKLSLFKLNAVDFEDSYLLNGKRIINVDPGYVALEKVVAASTKNFSHRIYLQENIYADLQLYRKNKKFQALPWTFYDYQKKFVIDFFDNLRKELHILVGY